MIKTLQVNKAIRFGLQKTMVLEEQLIDSVSSLEDTRLYVSQLQAQTTQEKKERARWADCLLCGGGCVCVGGGGGGWGLFVGDTQLYVS